MPWISRCGLLAVSAAVAAGACAAEGSGDEGGPDQAGPDAGELGVPGCGLEHAAFCESFDAPSSTGGRAAELDSSRWSLSRIEPEMDAPFVIGPASVSSCRADVPAQVFPPDDSLICGPNAAISSSHLLVAVAAQNYGSNGYRIRQPFDFDGRTGTVVFDADASLIGPLLGWISVEVIEDPMNSPSFSMYAGAGNFEGGVIPRNGVEVQFAANCGDGAVAARVGAIHEFRDYADHVHDASSNAQCFSTSRDHLNRFEIRLSQSHIEVWATPFSSDGVTFDVAQRVASADLDLPFSRGYVSITTHNHATLKYSDDAVDAWVTRWDNVGFDGPVISNTREYEAPDSLREQAEGFAVGYPVYNVGGPEVARVTIGDVAGAAEASRARMSFNLLYRRGADISTYALRYRLNRGAWHDYPLTEPERSLLSDGVALEGDYAGSGNALVIGTLGHVIEIPVAELVDGANTVDISTVNVQQGYLSIVSNVDLILD